MTQPLKLQNPKFASFYKENPKFDILHFDFHDKNVVQTLKIPKGSSSIETLKTYQRLIRLSPDEKVAQGLLDNGIDSAHQIAAMHENEFIGTYQKKLGLSTEQMEILYNKAKDVKAKTMLLWGNAAANNTSLNKALSTRVVGDASIEYFQNLPGYQDMFGNLNYCECQHCKSILGPAAYFVDLMRITDRYITQPNTSTIPANLALKDRRPDLFTLPLTCENTNGLIPYLQVINEVLGAQVNKALSVTDPQYGVALATFPFNLPVNIPQKNINQYLNKLNTSFSKVYQALKINDGGWAKVTLDVSQEWFSLITTATTDDAKLKAYFGMDNAGDSWKTELAIQETFLFQTGLTFNEMSSLLNGNLSKEEINAKFPHSFFINQSLPDDGYVYLDEREEDPTKNKLTNLDNTGVLDRVNRFVRLARQMNWTFPQLNLVLRSLGTNAIDSADFTNLVKFKSILDRAKLSVETLSASIADMNTFGCGNATLPIDLFDQVYNNPFVSNGQQEYHPVYTENQFYTDKVQVWVINSQDTTPGYFGTDRVAGALNISKDQLTSMGIAIWGDGNTVNLNVPNLSLLYRHSQLFKNLGFSVSDYFTFLSLTGMPNESAFTVEQLISLFNQASWLKYSGLTPLQVNFILTGTPNKQVYYSFGAKNITSLMNSFWALANGSLINKTSFENENIISQEDSEKIYTFFVGKNLINDLTDKYETFLKQKLPNSAGLVLREPTETEISELNTEINPLEPETFDEYVKLVITKTIEAQQTLLSQQIGVFVGSSGQMAEALLNWATVAENNNSLTLLYTPLIGSTDSSWEEITGYLQFASRYNLLVNQLRLDAVTVQSIVTTYSAFNIPDLSKLNFNNLDSIYQLQQFVNYYNKPEEIAAYFAMPSDTICTDGKKAKALALITQWPEAQICSLVNYFGGQPTYYDNLTGVLTLKAVFDISLNIGTDISAITGLASLNGLPADGNSNINNENVSNWSIWKSSEENILQTIKLQYTDVEWKEVSRKLNGQVMPTTRDTYLKLVTWYLHQTYPDIEYARNVSEYLLMDVETSGCSDISSVKQGLLALQMYLQRCRIGIEIGANTQLVPNVWWEWIMNYRLWEANRKVFLYPENYIDPGLRINQSTTYADLKNSLLQSDITSENVRKTYIDYFTGFSDLANLVDAGNYRCNIADEDTPEPTDTIFFFGRTNTKPYIYYYRKCINPSAQSPTWTYWEKIDAKVTSDYISPLYAFNKLFLFWVEIKTTEQSVVKDNNTVSNTIFQSKLFYTFYNFSKVWVQEQYLNDNYNIYSWPDQYISDLTDWINEMDINFSKNQLYWQKAYPMTLQDKDGRDIILMTYGNVFNLPKGTPKTPPEPGNATSPEQNDFNQNLYNAIVRANNAANAGMTGYNVLTPGVLIKQDLQLDETPIILQNIIMNTPYPYRAEMDTNNAILKIIESENAIVDNYYGDMGDNFGQYGSTTLTLLNKISTKNVCVTTLKNQVGSFVFRDGKEAFLSLSQQKVKLISDILKVNYGLADSNETDLLTLSYTDEQKELKDINFKFIRIADGAIQPLSNRLFIGGVDALLAIGAQSPFETPGLPFGRFNPTQNVIVPTVSDGAQVDFNGSYGSYYWEVFFHIPFLIAKNLTANRQFGEAQKWYQYIFDPTKPVSEGLPVGVPEQNKYWYFYPFRIQKSIASIQENLTNEDQIKAYNDHPFDPHAIANLRIGAYEKCVVMNYIENLLDWADDLFSRDSWENITQAITLYLLAYDLLGNKPEKVGDCDSTSETVTFQKIMDAYSGKEIPQFLIELESQVPYTETTTQLESMPFNEIDYVFCVPENDYLLKLWDRIEGQLYKIRNCMDIDGQVRQLALFEPPIDVFSLVSACATSGGKSPINLLQQLKGNGSQYRFAYLIQKAQQTVSTVMDFGSKLLSVLEKCDAEALILLQSSNQIILSNMLTINKQNQIEAAEDNLKALKESYKNATDRFNKYTGWIQIGLIPNESANLDALDVALGFNIASTIAKTASSILYSIPQVGSPFAMTYGGIQLGNVSDAIGAVADMGAVTANYVATTNQIKAGYKRREQEWELQAQLAQGDVVQINQQIAAQEVQLQIAQQELSIHEKQIVQEQEVHEFYQNKFTNESLYQWMAARLSTLYYQMYQLALEMAIIAQQTFQYELNVKDNYVSFGYWDSLKKGLLAGEGLMFALDQMDKAYTDKNNRRLEIEKTVSLIELAPYELINLKTNGVCNFSLNEKLFASDYPGHYCRRIKNISISIPAVVGPYQNIKATLTQKSNKIVLSPSKQTVTYLITGEGEPESGTLTTNWRTNQQVALSSGVNDTGVFELNFQDERFLPFEGTGAASDWELEMPIASNRINFESISDVIIKINYTALDGGKNYFDEITSLPALQVAENSVYFNCNQNFASKWYCFMDTPPENDVQAFTFEPGKSLLVSHVENMVIDLVYLQLDVPENTSLSSATPFLSLNIGSKSQKIILTQNYACIRLDPAVGDTDYLNNWKLSVDLKNAPASLLKDGKINPEILLNIELIIVGSGQVNWSKADDKTYPCKN